MSSEVSDASSSWYEFLGWLETNKKTLAWAGAGILVVIFVGTVYQWNARQSELASEDALLQLRANAQPGRNETAATADDFLKVTREFRGTSAAERALLLAAGASFTEGNYAQAQTLFNQFLQEHPSHSLASVAAQGVAAALEAQDKKDEALAAYQSVLGRFPSSPLAEGAKLAIARIYEAKNQPELALRTYDEIAKAGAMSNAGNQAMTRKQQLLAMFPELAKTNTVPSESPKVALPSSATNSPMAKP